MIDLHEILLGVIAGVFLVIFVFIMLIIHEFGHLLVAWLHDGYFSKLKVSRNAFLFYVDLDSSRYSIRDYLFVLFGGVGLELVVIMFIHLSIYDLLHFTPFWAVVYLLWAIGCSGDFASIIDILAGLNLKSLKWGDNVELACCCKKCGGIDGTTT